MSLTVPKCDLCKHCFDDDKYRCEAFPDGIPSEKIIADEDEECANGIKFEEE